MTLAEMGCIHQLGMVKFDEMREMPQNRPYFPEVQGDPCVLCQQFTPATMLPSLFVFNV